MSLLLLDVGNTRLKWGLYEAAEPGSDPVQHGAAFLENIEALGESDWARLPEPHSVLGSCVAGGGILPGHGIMLRALEGGTANLRVPTGEVVTFPTNTSDALTSGGTYAITGAIERMHRHLLQRGGLAPRVLVTGGAGWKVAPYL